MEKNAINHSTPIVVLDPTNITAATISKGFDLAEHSGSFSVVVDCISYNAGDFNVSIQYGDSLDNFGFLQNPVNLDAKYYQVLDGKRVKNELPETIKATGQYQFAFERPNPTGGQNIKRYFSITITPTNQSGTNEFRLIVSKKND